MFKRNKKTDKIQSIVLARAMAETHHGYAGTIDTKCTQNACILTDNTKITVKRLLPAKKQNTKNKQIT